MSARPRARRGQSLVEFALITPLFLTLLFGIVEGARIAYAYNALNHAANEAGRYASLRSTPSVDAVKARAVAAADPLAISAADVTVSVDGKAFADREIGDRLTVSVGYRFVPIAGIVFGSRAGFSLTGHTEVMVE